MMLVVVAWLAAALVFAAFFMKTIVPLRGLAVASNLAFIVYALLAAAQGLLAAVLPILVLHAALLPLNLLRLREVLASIRAVRAMRGPQSLASLLMPHMALRRCPAGSALFRQGDAADAVYVLKRGTLRIVEFDKTIAEGELFGEIAVFHEDARRTATAVCETDCELYAVAGTKVLELFYQDQRVAFQIARGLSRYA